MLESIKQLKRACKSVLFIDPFLKKDVNLEDDDELEDRDAALEWVLSKLSPQDQQGLKLVSAWRRDPEKFIELDQPALGQDALEGAAFGPRNILGLAENTSISGSSNIGSSISSSSRLGVTYPTSLESSSLLEF